MSDHASYIIACTINATSIITVCDGSSIIKSAHASYTIACTINATGIITVCDGSIISSDHASYRGSTIEIRVQNTYIGNLTTVIPEQSYKGLILIGKI